MRDCPLSQLVPFIRFPTYLNISLIPTVTVKILFHLTVDWQSQLEVLVGTDLLDDLGEVSSSNIVIRLQEHLPQSGLSHGVVFGVELVKAMEGVPVISLVNTKLVLIGQFNTMLASDWSIQYKACFWFADRCVALFWLVNTIRLYLCYDWSNKAVLWLVNIST